MNRKRERKLRFAVGGALVAVALAGLVAIPLFALPAWSFALVAGLALLAMVTWIGRPGVPVLTYHSVTTDGDWLPWAPEISVHPESLKAQLAMLKRLGMRAISTRELFDRRHSGHLPDMRSFVLHFDDGYRDNYLLAADILKSEGMTATCFVSLDFIEPGDSVRKDRHLAGYMNWAEIRSLRDDFGWEIEPHGLDHGRVAVSDRTVDVLTPENWKLHAWLQWRHMPGPKYAWYLTDTPPAVPLGSAVPESGLALACREWKSAGLEDEDGLVERLRHHLGMCRTVFTNQMGKAPSFFCWPENYACAKGRQVARELGYLATTAGKGRNAKGEPEDTISRIHAGGNTIGRFSPAADALYLRAQVRLVQGRYYWYGVIALMNALKSVLSKGAGTARS
jgi:hypothetical protein